MTSSSPEPAAEFVSASPEKLTSAAVTSSRDAAVRAMAFAGRELRSGTWTRLGDSAVLGDEATERTLSALAEEAKTAARSQGYLAGWAEGRRAADVLGRDLEGQYAEKHRVEEERREAEHQEALAVLHLAAARLRDTVAEVCQQVEASAAQTAVTLTEELLGHELALATAPGVDAVRRALELMPGEPVVRIRLHPDEAPAAALTDLAGTATVVADPSLSRGDALVETVDGVIDVRISEALERVREVLLG